MGKNKDELVVILTDIFRAAQRRNKQKQGGKLSTCEFGGIGLTNQSKESSKNKIQLEKQASNGMDEKEGKN